MTREQRKSLTAAIIGVLALLWIICCAAYVLAQQQEVYPAPLPLCIDAPEVTCIVPNYEDVYTGENS
jgi:hypothetical protein